MIYKNIFFWRLEVEGHWRKGQDPDLLVRGRYGYDSYQNVIDPEHYLCTVPYIAVNEAQVPKLLNRQARASMWTEQWERKDFKKLTVNRTKIIQDPFPLSKRIPDPDPQHL